MIQFESEPSLRTPSDFVARSAVMRELAHQLERAAELDANVLIAGAAGTGRSAMGRLIHELGPRAGGPLVVIPCAELPRERMEAQLFGDKGRPARGGTLLLEEVEEMPLDLQRRLVHLLQERVLFRAGDIHRLDTRIVATTRVDLQELVKLGRFREDLFLRLNVLRIDVPRLAERREDLPELVERFLTRLGGHYRLTRAAQNRLLHHNWPGNLRELENVLARAAAFSRAGMIDIDLIQLQDAPVETPERPKLAGYTMEQIERWALLDTLDAVGGNKAAAARSLGVCEKTVYNKLKRMRLQDRRGL
ncbi:MAG: sigma 54-interacting transcriptional regulator [Planctomycetota bacterium]